MDLWLNPEWLARAQFAFVVSFHIIFPAFTIGLASWLAVLEGMWLKTGNDTYREIYRWWCKIFAVTFGMGVVSGVVLSFQFGTNWAPFADSVANVIGPLLGFEVLTAFFLEASFLGIMLFGWGRVSRKMHFASTCIVAVGTLISAFWILSANSWMQTPVSFRIDEHGLLHATHWLEVIFNPSFPYRFSHMVIAAYLTTAFVVGAAASYNLLRKKFIPHSKIMLGMAISMAAIVAPIQLVIGDLHGINTLEHQPAKVAAMEGIWETQKGADLQLIAWNDIENERINSFLSIPHGASWILTHKANGEIKGLKEWPADERPPVNVVFWSFRIMVGLGLLMIITGFAGVYLYRKGRLFTASLFHKWCIAMGPSGFIAVLAGWFVTETGRQPYTVYGVLHRSDGVSPVPGEAMLLTFILFIIIYFLLFGTGTYYAIRLMAKGPQKKSETGRVGITGRLSDKGE